jgi:hemoglobin
MLRSLTRAALLSLTIIPLATAATPFDQFGGQPGIHQVVEDFVATVTSDPRISGYFAHAHIAHLKYELDQQFCALLGGPCTYTGKDMKSAHVGMNITQAAFNALDEDLNTAMDKNNIPVGAQNYLTGKLAPMEQPVVTKTGL